MLIKTLTAGTSFNYSCKATDGYTSAVMTLKTASHAKITLSGTLTGGQWLFTASATATASYTVGDYVYQLIESNTSGVVRLVETGKLKVLVNLATADANYDPRSADEKMLEAVIAVMADNASESRGTISIDGATTTYRSFKDLENMKAYYEQRIEDAYNEENGGGSGTIFTTFTRK